jgi:hypothetical protein
MKRLRRGMPRLALLALIVPLALLAVSYGLWSKTLFIEGTVETGNVDGEWTFVMCGDIEEKDVGSIEGEIDPDDPQIVRFTVEDAYPSYVADCEVEFRGTGSVPVDVESISFVPITNLTNCVVQQVPGTGSMVVVCDQMEITWANNLCVQLHDDDPVGVGSSIRFHVLQDADMDTTYVFGIEVLLVQYNESTCP